MPDMTIISPDGTKLAARSSGHGSPIVLVHGALGDLDNFALIERPLAERHSVWVYSRRARGDSGDGPEYAVQRDIHADWQHWKLDGDQRHRFVCRSRDLTTYEDNFELTGFSFGNRKSKTITARIYDKTREIDGNGHDWWHDVWGTKFELDLPVLRTEFEFPRRASRDEPR